MRDDDRDLSELLAQAPATTRRPTVPAVEELLYRPLPVLDHGLVRVIDYMGDDGAVVQAARVSYGRGTKTATDDRGLVRYLMRHRHTTPFEMCEIKFHVKLPIFVARQWIRHRTASVNEYSARYSILDREFYLPGADALAAQSSSNRQGRDRVLDADEAAKVLDMLRRDAMTAYDTYEYLLNEKGDGQAADEERSMLARELARMNLTLNYYTQWYWKIDLHNLLHFLSLRMDAHAQYEIRAYADVMADVAQRWVPHVWEAFRDYRLGAAFLSRQELEIVKAAIDVSRIDELLPKSDLSLRERGELRRKLGVPPRKK